MNENCLARADCRSPAETATRDEDMGMQGQGAELRVLTMVSAQRWGQGRGSRGNPFSLRRDVSITEPRPHSPAPRWFPEAASGSRLRRIPVSKRGPAAGTVRSRGSAHQNPGLGSHRSFLSPTRQGRQDRQGQGTRHTGREQCPPAPRTLAPPPPRANPPALGGGARTCDCGRHRVPGWLERLRVV